MRWNAARCYARGDSPPSVSGRGTWRPRGLKPLTKYGQSGAHFATTSASMPLPKATRDKLMFRLPRVSTRNGAVMRVMSAPVRRRPAGRPRRASLYGQHARRSALEDLKTWYGGLAKRRGNTPRHASGAGSRRSARCFWEVAWGRPIVGRRSAAPAANHAHPRKDLRRARHRHQLRAGSRDDVAE